jgi:hypothetical protein
MSAPSDPIFAAIQFHREAYAVFDKAVDAVNANDDDKMADRRSRVAFGAVKQACRTLMAAEFTTIAGAVALLDYMGPLLREQGAPAMPLETLVDDQQWETAFGVFCGHLATRLTTLSGASDES